MSPRTLGELGSLVVTAAVGFHAILRGTGWIGGYRGDDLERRAAWERWQFKWATALKLAGFSLVCAAAFGAWRAVAADESSKPPTWTVHILREFSVEMPHEPKRTNALHTVNGRQVVTETIECESAGGRNSYRASCSDSAAPPGVRDDKVLEVVTGQLRSQVQGTIVRDTAVPFKRSAGRELVIESQDGQGTFRTTIRVCVKKGIVYRLISVTPVIDAEPAQTERVLRSFEIWTPIDDR